MLDNKLKIWYNKGTKKQKVGKIMITVTYSKGVYTITDNVKTYTFNINNGHLTNIKTNNIVSKPTFKKNDLHDALFSYYRENDYNAYANMLTALYSRLNSYSMTDTFNCGANVLTIFSALDKLFNVMPKGCFLTNIHGIEKLSNKQLVKVINYVREFNNPNGDNRINLHTIIERIQAEELATTYGNLPVEFVEKYKDILQTFYALGEDYRDIALYYFYNQKLYALRTNKDKGYSSYQYGSNYIMTYIECCKAMKKQPIKTNNFMREYIETIMAYDIWHETAKNERFLSQYERYKDNLTFSYGNYTVVLPKDIQDLVTEGNEMHHCVGQYRDKVADGDTLIVFIRHKDTPDKCYITAQISPLNGKIGQYYLAYDYSISKTEDLEFKAKLQEWLQSCKW